MPHRHCVIEDVKHPAPSKPPKETVWYCLDGVLAGPFPSGRLVPGPVGLVHVRNLRHKGIIGVRVRQHGADRKENFGNSQSRAPLVSKNIETDATIAVDIRVVDSSREVDFRGLEGVIRRELDLQEEDAS